MPPMLVTGRSSFFVAQRLEPFDWITPLFSTEALSGDPTCRRDERDSPPGIQSRIHLPSCLLGDDLSVSGHVAVVQRRRTSVHLNGRKHKVMKSVSRSLGKLCLPMITHRADDSLQ